MMNTFRLILTICVISGIGMKLKNSFEKMSYFVIVTNVFLGLFSQFLKNIMPIKVSIYTEVYHKTHLL